MHFSGGTPTQNGKFYKAAKAHRDGDRDPEPGKVFKKIKSGIWIYNGFFDLVKAWRKKQNGRQVFKFKLELVENELERTKDSEQILEHT